MIHLHHVNLFSHDLDDTVAWYRRAFDAEIYYDGDFGGSRNVFMKIGTGRIHFYSQPPPDNGKGAIHHIGIRTNGLPLVIDTKLVAPYQSIRLSQRCIAEFRKNT